MFAEVRGQRSLTAAIFETKHWQGILCRLQDTLAEKNRGKCGYASVSDVESGAQRQPYSRLAIALVNRHF